MKADSGEMLAAMDKEIEEYFGRMAFNKAEHGCISIAIHLNIRELVSLGNQTGVRVHVDSVELALKNNIDSTSKDPAPNTILQ